VLYLTFNEGYASSGGPELVRVELATEAIRLARALHRLVPDDAETAGLLALMLLTDARAARAHRAARRADPARRAGPELWDRAAIDGGRRARLRGAREGRRRSLPGPGRDRGAARRGASAADTDWPQILALYGLLERMSDNPMVALNRAVALAMVAGPAAGLARLAELEQDERIAGHHRLVAVRAHLQERAGERDAAIATYHLAARLTASLPERNYLTTKAARLAHG
jgi:predicted RNA polymerase sigma factor